ncbi:MAG: polyisoprenoid-binding protein [Acidobacteria bacterium]|nr:MAG: polyisoprenoid-binding protein [Acidobacteriota bacterium]
MKPQPLVVLALAAALAASVTVHAQQPPTRWTIDPAHSAASFGVKHMLVSTVRGTLGPVTGSIWYDGKNLSSIKADVSIDVKGLSTGVAQRDAHLRTPDFFAVDQFPAITFKSTRVVPGAGGAFKLIGDLTIRDVTKEVTLDVDALPATITAQGAQRTATSATTTINRFDYNLKWNGLIEAGGAVVGPDVKVQIDLEVVRK